MCFAFSRSPVHLGAVQLPGCVSGIIFPKGGAGERALLTKLFHTLPFGQSLNHTSIKIALD